MIFKSPDVAYRWLMRRVRAPDRELLARSNVRISLQAAMGEGLRPGVEGVAQDLRLYCSPWRLQFADIDVPTIIWQGSDDPVVPPEAAYALARALPNCRLDVIPAAGHYWVFSRFGLILDAVAAVLRADAAAGAGSPAERAE
jgi:pimeloyl-ACP methyl ester carboxylesterase